MTLRPMYRVKQRLLGKPLTTERVTEEKLGNRSPDRRLRHAMRELAARTTQDGQSALTVIVPRRT